MLGNLYGSAFTDNRTRFVNDDAIDLNLACHDQPSAALTAGHQMTSLKQLIQANVRRVPHTMRGESRLAVPSSRLA